MPERRVVCHDCGRGLVYEDVLSRGAACEQCNAELRCCMNCSFYDPSAYNECAEPSADRVLEKARANFCDYFSPGERGTASKTGSASAVADLEAMFKKK